MPLFRRAWVEPTTVQYVSSTQAGSTTTRRQPAARQVQATAHRDDPASGAGNRLRGTDDRKLYFGYGSNMSRTQMRRRGPSSTFVGVGRLPDHKWFINQRGFANIGHSPGNEVYAMIYTLTPRDEARLDLSEGVPRDIYSKYMMDIDFWPAINGPSAVGDRNRAQRRQALLYVDCNVNGNVSGDPREEYVGRMNAGISDAIAAGVPRSYIERAIRHYIPRQPGAPTPATPRRNQVTTNNAADIPAAPRTTLRAMATSIR